MTALMKKVFSYLLVALFLNSIAYGNILDENGTIRGEALEVFWNFRKVFDLPEVFPDDLKDFKDIDPDKRPTLQTLNGLAQKTFLRPKGEERLSDLSIKHYYGLCTGLSLTEKERIVQLFRNLGDIEEIAPKRTNPDYILIQGSTAQNIRERVMYIVEKVRTGQLDTTLNPKIVFISGERPLFSSETPEVLLNPAPYQIREGWVRPDKLPTDESELSAFVWNQLDLPEEIRRLEPQFVNAEKQSGASRATTEDGARKWFQGLEETKGHCWVVSNNPFIDYQKRVTEWMAKKYLLHGQLVFEGVGSKAPIGEYPLEIAIGILLDNLARTLYTLQQIGNL